MNSKIEAVIRSILKADGSVSERTIEEALCVMKGDDKNPISPLHYITFKELYEISSLKPATIRDYTRWGLLKPVYHPGRQPAIGVTRESYRRMTERRTPEPIQVQKT